MAPLLITLGVVAVLLAGAWYVGFVDRRRRRGLDSLAGPTAPGDPVANAERIRPGTIAEATGQYRDSGGNM